MGLSVAAQSFYPDAQTTFFKVDELSEGFHIDLCVFLGCYILFTLKFDFDFSRFDFFVYVLRVKGT